MPVWNAKGVDNGPMRRRLNDLAQINNEAGHFEPVNPINRLIHETMFY